MSILNKKLLANPRFSTGMCLVLFMVIIAIFADQLAPYAMDDTDITKRMCLPSSENWLGCDIYGGDVLTSTIHGTKTTVYIAFLTLFISISIGTVLGLIAGYFRGFAEVIIMRSIDVLLAFPGILLAMALAALLGPSSTNVIIAISATGWTAVARLVRGEVLKASELDYIVSSRSIGASNFHILRKHIFPNVLSPLLVLATFNLSGIILIEASLSFLGLSGQDTEASWGALLNQGRTVLTEAPHISIVPGLLIFIVVLAINFMGDALRDHYDPKMVS